MRDTVHSSLAEEPSFREMVDALSLGVAYRMQMSADGRQGRFLRLSDSCQAILGVPAEAILGDVRAFSTLVATEDLHRLVAEKEAALAEVRPCQAEIRIRRPNGELRWCRLSSTPQMQPDGTSIWDGLLTDVTEPRRMAEQLAEERRRLELAIELTGMGVFEWDRDDPENVRWSDHQYAIYGVPPQTPMTVLATLQCVHPDDHAEASAASRAAIDAPDGRDYSVEHRIVRPDGTVRWVLLHRRITRDAAGLKAVHGTTLDVTERRNAEERRRLQMRELAHRGKNAMAVMMAMVQQAARSTRTVEELSGLILARFDAMARSQDLASALDGAPLPLPQLIRQVLEVFDLARFDIDPALEAVTVNGELVIGTALLLHELATNAVKYGALSNADGRVALALRPATAGVAVVEWRERGGPAVAAPGHKGFGTRLLAAALQGRGGRVETSFAPDGFAARVEMPLR